MNDIFLLFSVVVFMACLRILEKFGVRPIIERTVFGIGVLILILAIIGLRIRKQSEVDK